MAQNNTTQPGSLSQMRRLQAERSKTDGKDKPAQPRQRRPNYHQIHARPLPLETYPLPAFVPHNPLSYVRIAAAFISNYIFAPTIPKKWQGYFDAPTRSVHVTDPEAIRALWEMGFFGKGSLSRSEPNWLAQEKKRLGLLATSTSEEITEQRRLEREWMKRERARVEQEILMQQIKKETDTIPLDAAVDSQSINHIGFHDQRFENQAPPPIALSCYKQQTAMLESAPSLLPNAVVVDQEHLQLSLEEAFFLIYALGAMELVDSDYSHASLFMLFRQYSYFPVQAVPSLSSDDPFLINFAVYHHYRSLGWVVREGLKFAVDYMLYESGPVFKHAAFAVIIVPSYPRAVECTTTALQTPTQRRKYGKDWTWLHSINRVQTQVLKTLILCYVDLPTPSQIHGKDMSRVLRQYRVRDFAISRWSANRNRD